MINYSETDQLETPFFLFNAPLLEKEVSTIQQLFTNHWSNYMLAYSVKTNSFPTLGALMLRMGAAAEVVSEDEYNLVEHIGFAADNIVSNGPIKSASWVHSLLNKNAIINIDSKREIDYVIDYVDKNPTKKVSIGIRMNVDIEAYYPGESKANVDGSRFGFSYENGELGDVINKIKLHPSIAINGLHLHINTQSRSTEMYRFLVRYFSRVINEYNLDDIAYFDIGGSFFGGMPNKPTWSDYIPAIADELLLQGFDPNKLKLIIEPGIGLLASCFDYVTSVVDIKTIRDIDYAVFDGSRIHVDPLMHKENYFYSILPLKSDQNKEVSGQQSLVGFTCMENDRFFKLHNQPKLRVGDRIVFHKMGAYTLTLAPLFISYFPPVYMLNNKNEIVCARPKWGVNEFVQLADIDKNLKK